MNISATEFIQEMKRHLQQFGEEVEYQTRNSDYPAEATFNQWAEWFDLFLENSHES